jgi:hypothetical protein
LDTQHREILVVKQYIHDFIKIRQFMFYLRYIKGVFVSTDRGMKDCVWRETKWKGDVSIIWNTIERHRKEILLMGPTLKLFPHIFGQKVVRNPFIR